MAAVAAEATDTPSVERSNGEIDIKQYQKLFCANRTEHSAS